MMRLLSISILLLSFSSCIGAPDRLIVEAGHGVGTLADDIDQRASWASVGLSFPILYPWIKKERSARREQYTAPKGVLGLTIPSTTPTPVHDHVIVDGDDHSTDWTPQVGVAFTSLIMGLLTWVNRQRLPGMKSS